MSDKLIRASTVKYLFQIIKKSEQRLVHKISIFFIQFFQSQALIYFMCVSMNQLHIIITLNESALKYFNDCVYCFLTLETSSHIVQMMTFNTNMHRVLI